MQILEKYTNFIHEIKDAGQEKDQGLKDFKTQSVGYKTLGAALMISASTIAIASIVTAIPTFGLSLIALVGAVGLGILGYDLAVIGDAMRKHIDTPVQAVANGALNFVKNAWNMGLKNTIDYTSRSYFAEDTIIVSKIRKFVVYLQNA